MAYPLVMLEWEDSAQPVANWQWVEEFEAPGAVIIRSVGWLVRNDDQLKVLAPNLGGQGGAEEQMSGMIQIPARCVVRETRLTCPSSRPAKAPKRQAA